MRLCGIALLRVAPFAEMVKHGFAAMRKAANAEMWQVALPLPVPLICAGYLAGQAADRWNRSILPMQSIGKKPVNLDCLVCLAKLPGCHVGETCVSAGSWKAVACRWQQGMAGCAIPSAWSRSCRANPRPPMAVVALGRWDNAAKHRRPPAFGTVRTSGLAVGGSGRDGRSRLEPEDTQGTAAGQRGPMGTGRPSGSALE